VKKKIEFIYKNIIPELPGRFSREAEKSISRELTGKLEREIRFCRCMSNLKVKEQY
jgi:hypothetical protein